MVVEGGLSPTYVLDEMQMYELEPLVSNIHRKNKDTWEQTRFISYIIAQVNSTQKLKINDILNFSWDEESEQHDTSISNEDIERLRMKAKQYLNRQNNEGLSNKTNIR